MPIVGINGCGDRYMALAVGKQVVSFSFSQQQKQISDQEDDGKDGGGGRCGGDALHAGQQEITKQSWMLSTRQRLASHRKFEARPETSHDMQPVRICPSTRRQQHQTAVQRTVHDVHTAGSMDREGQQGRCAGQQRKYNSETPHGDSRSFILLLIAM